MDSKISVFILFVLLIGFISPITPVKNVKLDNNDYRWLWVEFQYNNGSVYGDDPIHWGDSLGPYF
ncbi:MAG: hypothetical protein ACXAC7_21400, partial [Candidatus Hodarchaeales archaeon]